MEQRLNIENVSPEAFKAMLQLENYARSSVPPKLYALIKLRASVLNGCAYCIDLHTTHALRDGETSRRLFAVAAWRESPLFSDVERVAFALTDAVTHIGQNGVPDDVWHAARNVWSEKEVLDVLMAIVTINGWNRIAVSTHAKH